MASGTYLMAKLEVVCVNYATRHQNPKLYRAALRRFADALDGAGDVQLSDFMEELHKLARTKKDRGFDLQKAFVKKLKVP